MKKPYINSLFFKIAGTVTVGILLLAMILTLMNIVISKRIFVNSFAESQEKIFNQIDSHFYEFYKDMMSIMTTVSASGVLEDYIYGDDSGVESMENSYQLRKLVQNSKMSEYNEVSTIVIGENRRSYISNDANTFVESKAAVMSGEIARKAKKNRGKVICEYREKGFTSVTRNSPVVIFAKAWNSREYNQRTTTVFLVIKEEDLRKMYSSFTVSANDIILLNQDNEAVSSDNTEYLKGNGKLTESLNETIEEMEKKNIHRIEKQSGGNVCTYMLQKLQSTDYKIVGIVNPEKAFQEEYSFGLLIAFTVSAIVAIVFLTFLYIRKQTQPLYKLVEAMQNSRKADYKEHVEVQGTDEVRRLSETYNEMMDELETYIGNLIKVEKDKRAAEIHTLQMQINPHYIYNTLASIKWLIWQGDSGKSTEVIDAFISLLRNTVSNTDEFVTVGQELKNLKNYVLINQARYGDAVQTEFYVVPQCEGYKVPKLILQPFVENAFFHAFPEGRRGRIRIFVKEEKGRLRFDIADDGVGIKTEQLLELNGGGGPRRKSEHFTGIGIGNVDERIRLIYGNDYGINITSEEEKGTTVTLILGKIETIAETAEKGKADEQTND